MRLLLGGLFWLILLLGGGAALVAYWPEPALEPARRLVHFLGQEPARITVVLPREIDAAPGLHVLTPDPDQFLKRIGAVQAVERGGGRTRLQLEIFPEELARFPDGAEAVYFTVPGSAAWIVKTLIPRERVQFIRTMWEAFYRQERQTIVATLWPSVRESLQEILQFYEREIPRVLKQHRVDLDELAARHRTGTFEKELMPAVKLTVWELSQKRFAPLLEEVGRELWTRLPVWGLGWRYMYEFVPFTGDDHVTRRFNLFLENDALPLLQDRTDEIVGVLSGVFQDTVREPRVVAALKKMFGEVASDPETTRLFKELTAELLIRNERLRALVREHWEEKGLREAVARVGERFEPLIKDAINAIVLRPDRSGLHPRLTRVLRARVLYKDQAWVLLEPGSSGPRPTTGTEIPGRIDGHD